MSQTAALDYQQFFLPPSIVSKLDVSRLVAEVEWIDSELTAADVRAKVGKSPVANPTISPQLSEFLTLNSVSLTTSRGRSSLITQLRLLKDNVPTLHMTFASPADRASLETLAEWTRKNAHSQAVIEAGLQPDLVGGVYLRTPNHIHDLSLREKLRGKHIELVKELEMLRAGASRV